MLIFNTATGEYFEAEIALLHRTLHHFEAHAEDERRHELNRSNDNQQEDSVHDTWSLDELVVLTSLVVKSKVDDADLDEKRGSL